MAMIITSDVSWYNDLTDHHDKKKKPPAWIAGGFFFETNQ